MGDLTKAFVRSGNSLMIVCSMIMVMAVCLGHAVGIEQPSTSAMYRTPWMSAIFSHYTFHKVRTYLGAFGGRTVKPLILMSTCDLSAMVRDKPIVDEALAKRGDGSSFTGQKEMLTESEMYTVSFSESLAELVKAQV